ncbi:translation initiation factor SUI1 protein [Rutstroemia sp. NJR-2017a WRK4]|nr:translation initiation factor SUI1 protein [Rutstroemia sp. NJR-2017a WRK4]
MKGRASVVFAIQNWLGESSESKKTSSQPAYFSVGMSDLPTNVPSPPCHTCAIGIIPRHGDCGRFWLFPRNLTMQSGYWKKQGPNRCGRKQ